MIKIGIVVQIIDFDNIKQNNATFLSVFVEKPVFAKGNNGKHLQTQVSQIRPTQRE